MLAGDLLRFIENINQLLLQLDARDFKINDDASACAFFKFVVLLSALTSGIIVHEGFPTNNLIVDTLNTRWVIVFTYVKGPIGHLKNPVFDESDQQFGSVGNFVSRTIITGGQSSKVAHFLYGFSAGFGVCGGGGGGAHA